MLKTRSLAGLLAAALSITPAMAMGPGRTPIPSPTPSPSPSPSSSPEPEPQPSYDLVIEIFRGDVAANDRVPGALVEVDGDSRTSDGSGFTHFFAPRGTRTIRVTAPGYLPLVTTHVHSAASSLKLSIVPPCFTAGADVEPARDEYVVALQAANGRYVAAECGGDDDGIVNADRAEVGAWETFYAKPAPDGTLAIRTKKGRYLAAEGAGGGELRANRTAQGPWETFRPEGALEEGGSVSLRTWSGQHWVTARLDSATARVEASATRVDAWERFTVKVLRGPSSVRRRTGMVRASGHDVRDDQGSFNALGASVFWAAWAFRNDRAKLERDLAYLAENGFDYIRVFGNLGCDGPGTSRCPWQGGTDWWEGREVSPGWSDYDQVIAGLTDLAYDQYGLRIEWTLIGDGQLQLPNESDRRALIDRFLAMSRGREQKIMHFEVANESWQNGFGGDSGMDQLNRLTRYMQDRTDILVAASTPYIDEHGGCTQVDRMYAGGVGDLLTFHYDRDGRMVDGQWRHVRQPWEYCGFNKVVSNNEPMGPGSSVNQEDDPLKLVMAAVVSYVSGNAMYVYHTEAGVWGGTHHQWTDQNNVHEYTQGSAFRAMRDYLPEGLAGWSRQNSYRNANHPMLLFAGGQADRVWPEGYGDGVVRAYGATNGNQFVVAPIGIRNFAEMQAKYDCEFDVIHPVTGEVVAHHDLRAGQAFTLRGLEAFVLKGRLK